MTRHAGITIVLFLAALAAARWLLPAVALAQGTPSVTAVSVGSIGSTTATVSVTLTNDNSAETTVYVRHRTPVESGDWSSTRTTTSGTSASVSLTGLTSGSDYRVEASVASDYASSQTADFDTLSPSVSAVSVGSITRITATVTLTIANSDGTATTFYVRHETPPGSGVWAAAVTVSSSGASAEVALTGLTPSSQFRVEAAADSAFGDSVTADFTTTANTAPAFAAATVTRSVAENAPAGHSVGAPVTASDADGDALTYSLGVAAASSFYINGATGQLTVGRGVSIDYETGASYSVTVTVTDIFDATDAATVTITVTDVPEGGDLGVIGFQVGGGTGGQSGHYGYSQPDGYGSLARGSFPGELFADGLSRTVSRIFEDEHGYWWLDYSGGAAADWSSDQQDLDSILVKVTYADGRDGRSFVLGGFITERTANSLKLDPPLPGRDWNDKDGQEVAIDFHRHHGRTAEAALPAGIVAPVASAGTIAWLLDQAPGDAVTTQLTLTSLVFVMVLFGSVAAGRRKRTPPPSTVFLLLVLLLTPWAPAMFGYGSYMLSSIISVLMLGAGFGYRQLTKQVR